MAFLKPFLVMCTSKHNNHYTYDYCSTAGGLGNQLFQYAAGLALSSLHNVAVKVDISNDVWRYLF